MSTRLKTAKEISSRRGIVIRSRRMMNERREPPEPTGAQLTSSDIGIAAAMPDRSPDGAGHFFT